MSIGKKRLAQSCHKLVVLSMLLQETLDEVGPWLAEGHDDLCDTEFKDACKVVGDKCEELLTTVFDIKEVRTSSYMTDLANQVDTTVRKNFKPVSGPINP